MNGSSEGLTDYSLSQFLDAPVLNGKAASTMHVDSVDLLDLLGLFGARGLCLCLV